MLIMMTKTIMMMTKTMVMMTKTMVMMMMMMMTITSKLGRCTVSVPFERSQGTPVVHQPARHSKRTETTLNLSKQGRGSTLLWRCHKHDEQ